MAPSKIRKVVGAVKDQTSIGLAKVSSSNSISDLDVAIVKATRHDEYPAEERYIREILSLTCYSRNYINQCVTSLSRRLAKTRSWTVALKTLILVHRLLTDGDPTYEQEIFFATHRGTRMLNLSDFRDTSRSDAWDFSAFVRTYARYLDEMLEYRMQGKRGRRRMRSRSQQMHEEFMVIVDEELAAEDLRASSSSSSSTALAVQSTPVKDMKTEKIFTRTQHLQQLLERFIACRPTGSAKHNRIVAVALHPILKESYQLYFDLREVMGIFIDRFMELELPDCVRVLDIFTRLSKQFDELDRFYAWCKTTGISRPSEIPDVERVTQQKLDVMDEFFRDRSALSKKNKSFKSLEQLTNEEDARREAEAAAAAAYALLAPEPVQAEEQEEGEVKEEEEEDVEREEQTLAIVKVEEVDFLNLRADAIAVEDNADKLALALFDGQMGTTATPAPVWEAFEDETADWETALVESASNLSGHRATLGGGFDMLLLDGMYSQSQQGSTLGFAGGNGSASSVALPKASPMLALPAPPTGRSGGGSREDPFAASLSVPAPSYVQMPELEKKQQLLMEEQMMWRQYARDGMQGLVSIANLQQAQAGIHLHQHHQYPPPHGAGNYYAYNTYIQRL